MLVLAVASASGGCVAALVQADADTQPLVVAERHVDAERGLPELIAPMLAELLATSATPPELVAVVVGPGSFTGLRAGIAVACGIGLARRIEVVGVSVAEALAEALPSLGGRTLWVANLARRDTLFLEANGICASYPTAALPGSSGRVAVAGDAANVVAATLAARGVDVMLTSARRPRPAQVAAVGVRRAAGLIEARPPTPLYIDAPEAKLPAGGLRPAPVS